MTPQPTASATADWRPLVDQTERTILIAVVAANAIFPLALFLIGLPKPWRIFEGEASPINWFSSVQLVILGVIGLSVFFVTRFERTGESDPTPAAWPWLVVSVGFFFLSFDEKFQIHETVREEWLKPAGIATGIPGLKSGDIVLLGYAVAGVFLTFKLVQDLRRHRRSLILFVAALFVIGVAATQDSLNLKVLKTPTVRHVQIVAEEVGEVWAQAMFAVAMIWFFFFKLRGVWGRLSSSRTE